MQNNNQQAWNLIVQIDKSLWYLLFTWNTIEWITLIMQHVIFDVLLLCHSDINLNSGHIQLKLNTLANSFISFSETNFFKLVSNNTSSLVSYFQIGIYLSEYSKFD